MEIMRVLRSWISAKFLRQCEGSVLLMDTIDISSSDSEVEDVTHEKSQFQASSEAAHDYRELPLWSNPDSRFGIDSEKGNGNIGIRNEHLSASAAPTTDLDHSSWSFPSSLNSANSSDGEVEVISHPCSSVSTSTFRNLPRWAHPTLNSVSKSGMQSKHAHASSSTTNRDLSSRFHPFNSTSESIHDLELAHDATKGNAFSATAVSSSYKKLSPFPDSVSNSKSSGGSNLKRPLHSMPTPDSRGNGWASHERVKMAKGQMGRVLPSSLGEGSQIKFHHPRMDGQPGANHYDHKHFMKDDFTRKNDVANHENIGSRRLMPPSLMPGKSVSVSQSAGLSESTHISGVGEEMPMENDERVIFQAALQDLSQPRTEANLPDGLLTVPLLRHQKIALAWMLQKESASLHCLGGILADDQGLGKTISIISLIQMQKFLNSKPSSKNSCPNETEALNLDEDDAISVTEKGNGNANSDDFKCTQEASTVLPAIRKGKPSAGTLVVCPASILRQWAQELDDKASPKAKLKVLIYHGTRTKDPFELAKYDVVLTTYFIVSNEVPKQNLADDDEKDHRNTDKYALSSEFSTNKKRAKTSNAGKKGKKNRKGIILDYESGPLAKVVWCRVVLDEAQTIKNHRTQVARACCGLRAKRRWCLSGTPIQNTVDDLYSYFRFLKYEPYSVYKCFCSSIKHQISRNAINGYRKLQAVLKTVMLRRTKDTLIDGEPIIKLPPKSICLKKVNFSDEERTIYSRLESEYRSQFKEYAAAGTLKQNYANILLMLLRLRQACDHPLLVKGSITDSVGEASLEMARKLPREMLINLLGLLEASLAICGVCSDPPENAVVTMCGHVFCYQCVSEFLSGDDNLCPAADCRQHLAIDIVFSKATLRNSISDEVDHHAEYAGFSNESIVGQNMHSSSKIRATLDILHSMKTMPSVNSDQISKNCYTGVHDPNHSSDRGFYHELPEKAIIFSQWTSMLDILEISLNMECIQYRRLDGTMTLASRERAIRDFSSDPEVNVIIMSLKAGNLGLNMVVACHVILLDLWWNPTTEDQAIDRAHRIGQTRPVTVSRLTIKDTVEDRILALQEEKRKMVSSAFGEDQGGTFASRLTVEDLRYLFGV